MFLMVSISILLAGALLVVLVAGLRFRHTAIVQTISAALALVALAGWGRNLPQEIVLLAWRPISLFGTPVVLSMEAYGWALAVAIGVLTLASSLAQVGRPTESPLHPALVLVGSALVLATLGAANLLTLALAWGFLDMAYGFILLSSEGQPTGHRLRVVLGLNVLATLLVWIACVFLEQDSLSPYWQLITVSPEVQTLLGLAALLRSGWYPLYAWSPSGKRTQGSLLILLHLMPMMTGLGLWIRLATLQALPGGEWWTGAALAGALLAGALAWLRWEASQALPYVTIGYVGLLILAGSGVGLPVVYLTQGAITWLFAAWVLNTTPPLRPPHSIPAIQNLLGVAGLVAVLALAGIPATSGFVYRSALHAGLVHRLWWGLAVSSEVLLAGAALRCTLTPRPTPYPAGRLRLIALAISLMVAALPLIIFGVWPALIFPSIGDASVPPLAVRGWAGWGAPLVAMIAVTVGLQVTHLGEQRRGQAMRASHAIAGVLDLSWLHTLGINSLRRGARLIGGLAALIEGRGALVWTLLFIVLALLYWNGSGR